MDMIQMVDHTLRKAKMMNKLLTRDKNNTTLYDSFTNAKCLILLHKIKLTFQRSPIVQSILVGPLVGVLM